MQFANFRVAATAIASAAALLGATTLQASPLLPALAAQTVKTQAEQASPLIDVRHRGHNEGAAVAAGIAGAIIGGIIASQARPYPEYYDPYYRPYPAYSGAVAYCARRFRSYDPYSMTYLGHDGYRHSCP